MTIRRPTKSNKNPPIFSHEFVIQNHADIVSCTAMVFVVGLMFQATNPVATMFITLQHNITVNATEPAGGELTLYTYGLKDLFCLFFYFLICIVVHAIIQEYILDKVIRRMHLSKVKNSKFNESGQLIVFYLASVVWGIDTLYRENYVTSVSMLWDGYPHANLPMMVKLYFLIQLAYWLHNFPELYFQKVKKDEMAGRIQYALLYIAFIAAAYLLNLTRVALCLLVVHYLAEFVFHLTRLIYFAEKTDIANKGFLFWDVLFVLVRLVTITLSVLTFWHGLRTQETGVIDIAKGDFNTKLIRFNCLAAICLLQAWLMWHFIMFHLRRQRDSGSGPLSVFSRFLGGKKGSKRQKKDVKREDGSTVNNVTPENGVRQRTPKAKRN